MSDDESKQGPNQNGEHDENGDEHELDGTGEDRDVSSRDESAGTLGDGEEDSGEELDSFSREYVEELRGEAAKHRRTAREAVERVEKLSRALFSERVRSYGLLADPDDMPYDEELLTGDDEAMGDAIRDLIASKPHLKSTRVQGETWGDKRGDGPGVSLGSILRANT